MRRGELDRSSWSTLVASYSDAVGRRWFSAFGPSLRFGVDFFTSSPRTRVFAAEMADRAHWIAQDQMLRPVVHRDLEFTIDEVAQAAGPRYRKLPPSWDGHAFPKLKKVNGSASLAKHFVVRPELEDLIGVSLVEIPAALRKPAAKPKKYRLEFEKHPTFTVSILYSPLVRARPRS
jgi:hypothetical protein